MKYYSQVNIYPRHGKVRNNLDYQLAEYDVKTLHADDLYISQGTPTTTG